MTRNPFARIAALFAVLGLGAPMVGAQRTGGRISGTVVDSSGAVLPGATVTIVQDQTQLTKSTTTDKEGAYLFVSLPVGTYTVSAELSGFKKAVRSGLQPRGRRPRHRRLHAAPWAQVSEVVEVTVAGETVNTTSGEIARVVDREQVQNLALNGRNYMQLATPHPGLAAARTTTRSTS